MSEQILEKQFTRQDFMSDQEIRWCPGCGDYSILMGVQKTLPDVVKSKEKQVFISGIGCASRFPYYMNAYGMHSIHGRAPAFATGLKIMNPDLDVWVISGDGDSLSIGGNHFLHLARRNVNLNLLIFNNQIYGLTKGQYSPTSKIGTKTKSSPMGSLDRPLSPLKVALGAEAGFIARTADILSKHMQEVLAEAYLHKGTTITEIYQNCHIFNDGVFGDVLDKSVRNDKIIFLEDQKPMIFGENKEKCLTINRHTGNLEVGLVQDVPESEILVHNASNVNPYLHFMLADMMPPVYPVAMGVIRKVSYLTYEEEIHNQENEAIALKGKGDLMKLLYSGETWTVS